MPNALGKKLKQKVTHDDENEVRYNLLYSVYSYPSIIVPLIGGILVDKLGLYKVTICFSILSMTGQAVFSLSGWIGTNDTSDNLPFIVALIGRLLCGIGGVPLSVCQSVYVARWFRGSELSFGLGLTTTVLSAAYSLNSLITPIITHDSSLGYAMTFGWSICILALIMAI